MNKKFFFTRSVPPQTCPWIKFNSSSTSLTFQKSKSTSDVVQKARPNQVVQVVNTEPALIISNGTNQEMCVPSLDQVPAYWIEF